MILTVLRRNFPQGRGPVLIVEDDPDLRTLLATTLEAEGFGVRAAANGAEALQAVAETAPALVILDLRMPVMDGWEFRRAQRADPKIAKTPVVVLSGADAHRFAELEALAAFEKPVRISELAVRLHQVFEDA